GCGKTSGEGSPCQVVEPCDAGESLKINGERGGNRTFNLLIKSQLLCQLSYAPEFNILAPDSSVATGIPLSFEIRLMHLLPTHDEVLNVLRDTGALRVGHFV